MVEFGTYCSSQPGLVRRKVDVLSCVRALSLFLLSVNYIRHTHRRHTDQSIVFARWRRCPFPYNNGSLGPHESATKQHIDQFSCFCRVHGRDQQTDRQTTLHHDVCSNSPHLVLRAAMRANNNVLNSFAQVCNRNVRCCVDCLLPPA